MVPDFRHRECRYWHYHQNLPSVSIIIIFKNEDLTIIKRTIQSIITAGPYQLIQEILIYDDGSDVEDIDELYDFAERWEGLVKIVRLEMQVGNIVAKTMAAQAAVGEVLVYLDPFSEVEPNWLGSDRNT